MLRSFIDKIKENGFKLTKERSRRYPAKTITDADYADDIALLANAPAQNWIEPLPAWASMSTHTRQNICASIKQVTSPHKMVDKFTYLGSSVSSTETDIDTRLGKPWTAIDRLSVVWKSDLTDKTKRSFFQAAVVSILLYGCTTWTLTKRMEKKLDGNYTRKLRAILNKSWRQHLTKQ